MIIVNRYSKVINKNKREIVLLKSFPCKWGICPFCDYIHDNSTNEEEMVSINRNVLKNITGEFKRLEVVNSGNVFELPDETLEEILSIVKEKSIEDIFFEAHWMYKDRLQEIRERFNINVIFKLGIETFDDTFRNKILKKGIHFESPEEVSKYFNSVCLLIGIKGQTRDMIKNDLEIVQKHFERACINIFTPNTTEFQPDMDLIEWFKEEYSYLSEVENIELLWQRTDFGVGD